MKGGPEKWLFIANEKFKNINGKQSDVRGVNTMKRCIGISAGSGDVHVNGEKKSGIIRSKTYIATPPGKTIQEQLDNHKIGVEEFASQMNIRLDDAKQLLAGEIQLSAELADKLEAVFGIPAKFWNKLETLYREKITKVETENAIRKEK